MNPDIHIKTEINQTGTDDLTHSSDQIQLQQYAPNLDNNTELRFNPVAFHNVSQLGKYFVLTNLFQGSNIYTIPKLPNIKAGGGSQEHTSGTLLSSGDSSLILSANGQAIPVSLGTVPTSVIENSNALLANQMTQNDAQNTSSGQVPHIQLQIVDPNLVHTKEENQMHHHLHSNYTDYTENMQVIKPDIKPQTNLIDVRGSVVTSTGNVNQRLTDPSIDVTNNVTKPINVEMLKVNIEDFSQFFNYHEVFGKISNDIITPSAIAAQSYTTNSGAVSLVSSNTNDLPIDTHSTIDPLSSDTTNDQIINSDNVCDLCGKMFQYKYQLIVHRRYHNERKPFMCQVCGQAFQDSQELTQHGKKHIGGSMFICNVCFHVFANEASLERHMKRHSADKPFLCNICQRTFGRREHLENHSRIHTGDCPFRCRFCAKTFTRKEHMVNHERKYLVPIRFFFQLKKFAFSL